MSSDRILGSACSVDVYSSSGTPTPVMEVDSFDAEPQHELKNFHPLGQIEEHGQLIYKSYKLTLKGAMINGDADQLQAAIDTALLAGQASPRYRVTQTTLFYDGTTERWIYDNALLYNVKTSVGNAEDAITQDIDGWAPKRVQG
jgi:hypothetical protein